MTLYLFAFEDDGTTPVAADDSRLGFRVAQKAAPDKKPAKPDAPAPPAKPDTAAAPAPAKPAASAAPPSAGSAPSAAVPAQAQPLACHGETSLDAFKALLADLTRCLPLPPTRDQLQTLNKQIAEIEGKLEKLPAEGSKTPSARGRKRKAAGAAEAAGAADGLQARLESLRERLLPAYVALQPNYLLMDKGTLCFLSRTPQAEQATSQPKRKKLKADPNAKGATGPDPKGKGGAVSLLGLETEQSKAATWSLWCKLDDHLGEVRYKICDDPSGTRKLRVLKEKPPAPAKPASKDGDAASVSASAGPKPSPAPAQPAPAPPAPAPPAAPPVSAPPQPPADEYVDALYNLKRFSLIDFDFSSLAKDDRHRDGAGRFSYRTFKAGDVVAAGGAPPDAWSDVIYQRRDDKESARARTGMDAIWIPKTLIDYFVDEQDPAFVVLVDKNDRGARKVSVDEKKNQINQAYVLTNGALINLPFTGAVETGGGGGGMRSDAPGEADYAWTSTGDDVALAIGLTPAFRKSNLKDYKGQQTRTPKTRDKAWRTKLAGGGDMTSEISYWKSFETPRAKKNEPKATKPLFPARAAAPNDLRQLYTRKRKQAWAGALSSSRGPVPIEGKKGGRESAGEVMGASLRVLGVPGDLSSATRFAAFVLEQKDAQAAWAKASEAVAPWDSKTATTAGQKGDQDKAEYKGRIRTDQEWCHLVGHGDGGLEVFENFVSGSEHCNTEQLAIETGQRTARKSYQPSPDKRIFLAVKVTAYLFPGQGFGKRTSLLPYEREFLASLELVRSADGKTVNLAQTLKAVGDAIGAYEAYLRPASAPASSAGAAKPADPIKALLPANVDKKSLPHTPTRDQWQAAEDERAASKDEKNLPSNRVADSVYEMLKAIQQLPLPLGSFIRYRIFFSFDQKGEYKKIFDHAFDAQNESFDFFEYKILETTVRRVIATAAGAEVAYRQEIKRKAKRVADLAKGAKSSSSAGS